MGGRMFQTFRGVLALWVPTHLTVLRVKRDGSLNTMSRGRGRPVKRNGILIRISTNSCLETMKMHVCHSGLSALRVRFAVSSVFVLECQEWQHGDSVSLPWQSS